MLRTRAFDLGGRRRRRVSSYVGRRRALSGASRSPSGRAWISGASRSPDGLRALSLFAWNLIWAGPCSPRRRTRIRKRSRPSTPTPNRRPNGRTSRETEARGRSGWRPRVRRFKSAARGGHPPPDPGIRRRRLGRRVDGGSQGGRRGGASRRPAREVRPRGGDPAGGGGGWAGSPAAPSAHSLA